MDSNLNQITKRKSSGYTKHIIGIDNEVDIDNLLRQSYNVSIEEDIDDNFEEVELEEEDIGVDVKKYWAMPPPSSIKAIRELVHEIAEHPNISYPAKLVTIVYLVSAGLREISLSWIPKQFVNIGILIIGAVLIFLTPWKIGVRLIVIKIVRKIVIELRSYRGNENFHDVVDKILISVDIGLIALSYEYLIDYNVCDGNLLCISAKSFLILIL